MLSLALFGLNSFIRFGLWIVIVVIFAEAATAVAARDDAVLVDVGDEGLQPLEESLPWAFAVELKDEVVTQGDFDKQGAVAKDKRKTGILPFFSF